MAALDRKSFGFQLNRVVTRQVKPGTSTRPRYTQQTQYRSAQRQAPPQFPRAAIPYGPGNKRRVAMALVELCTAYIESLWPRQECQLPLRNFVFEILRRSRVQYPVFQVALCYMARLHPVVQRYKAKGEPLPREIACGRRVLVSALQAASKFLMDHCYSADVWARISGLPREDLVRNELAFMEALDWRLYVSAESYLRSCNRLRMTVLNTFGPEPQVGAPMTPKVSLRDQKSAE